MFLGKLLNKIKASSTLIVTYHSILFGANATIYGNYLLGTICNTLFTDYPARNYLGKKKRRGKMYNYYT